MRHSMKLMLAILMLGLMAGATRAANLLDSATALWKFDAADSGAVSASQIIDSNDANRVTTTTTTNASLLNWNTTPPTGPGGNDAVDLFTDHGRGLEFNPLISTPGSPPTVTNGGFAVSGFSVTGSATIITRFIWDGYVDPTSASAWLYNNGHGDGTGWLFGISGSSKNLSAYEYVSGGDPQRGGIVSSLTLTAGVWYDAVMVLRSAAEEGSGADSVTFYLFPAGGSLQTSTLAKTVNTTAQSVTYVGSESLGAGTGNQRKAFGGIVDYLGVWDSALTYEQVHSILVPEPASISVIALLGVAAMMRRRRA